MTKERRKTVREWLYITAGILIITSSTEIIGKGFRGVA